MTLHTIPHQTEKLVKVNGLQLNYDSFGGAQDPVILLIMGLATQMIYWDEEFCKLLAAHGFRVIRFDNRDVGKSTWLDSMPKPSTLKLVTNALFGKSVGAAYLLKDMAQDTLELMQALGIKQAHIVGASMGGMIAQVMAINAPDKVLSLTSIMSTTGNRSLPKPSLKFGLKVFSPPPKNKQAFVPHGLKIWQALHGKHFIFDEQRIAAQIQHAVDRGVNLSGSGRQLAAIIDSPDRTLALSKLSIPTLVLHGESDPLVPVACGHATAEAIPNAQLKTYQGMGHTIPKELYSDMTQAIIDHAKKVCSVKPREQTVHPPH